jgi:hypothetical protein
VPSISVDGVMLAETAMTFGLTLLKNVLYDTSKEVFESLGVQVYAQDATPVLKEIFEENFEIVVLLTVASR